MPAILRYATFLLIPALHLLSLSGIAAQIPFAPSGNPQVEQEVDLGQANEVFLYFENLSPDDTLRLHWRLLEWSQPDGWDIDLCDFGTCYIGIPGNALMAPATGDDHPYLKLIVQPGSVPGAGWLWFRVYEEGHANDNYADVFFSLYTPGVTAVKETGAASVRVFPNPVRERLWVENFGDQNLPARLTDAAGRPVWEGVLPQQERAGISVETLPAGAYFLQTGQAMRRILVHP